MGFGDFLKEKYLQLQIATGSIFLFGWEKHVFHAMLVGGTGLVTYGAIHSLNIMFGN